MSNAFRASGCLCAVVADPGSRPRQPDRGGHPPALDQVLVGAVDRSRNPDLARRRVGLERRRVPGPTGHAPYPQRRGTSLPGPTRPNLGPDLHRQIGRERYYGYIACTRARERLLLTFARRDPQDRPLNPRPW
jgi:hypothetical protein